MLWHRAHRLLLAGPICLLILILAACGGPGGSNYGPSGTTPTAGSTSASGSTLSFTASGGLTGSPTMSAPGNSGMLTSGSASILTISTHNDTLDLNFTLGYTGPGSYSLAPNQPNVIFLLKTASTFWGLGSCTVQVTSGPPVNATGQQTRIKGTFSCSSLVDNLKKQPPVSISNGQFDVGTTIVSE